MPVPSRQTVLDANSSRRADIELDTKHTLGFCTDAVRPMHGIYGMLRCIFVGATSALQCCICLAMTDIVAVEDVLC